MEPAEHIREIKAAIHRLNRDGHIVEPEQFVAVIDLVDYVERLQTAFETLVSAAGRLEKTIVWHPAGTQTTLTPKLQREISAGEEIEENDSEDKDIEND